MQVRRVDEILGYVGTGITEPLFARIGNDVVVLKTINNVESNRVLANELVCYKIAKKIGLPIPTSGICMLDKNVIKPEGFELEEDKYGLGFYSTRLDKVTTRVLSPLIIQKHVPNKDEIPRIILFDHLIFNVDRHKGNILLGIGNDKSINIIDHTHAFYVGPNWDEYQLRRYIKDDDYLSDKILAFNTPLYSLFWQSIDINMGNLIEHCKAFQNKLNKDFFTSIIDDIPEDWGINNNEKTMLCEYLTYRLNRLNDICKLIFEYRY